MHHQIDPHRTRIVPQSHYSVEDGIQIVSTPLSELFSVVLCDDAIVNTRINNKRFF